MKEIITDLRAEHEALAHLLGVLGEAQWDLPTQAGGWSLRDSVSHIAYLDEVSASLIRGDTTMEEEAARPCAHQVNGLASTTCNRRRRLPYD